MFDLEPSLTEWRRRMLAAGLKTGRRLDELDSHLREEISALKSAGASEAVAFEQAVARLGSPHSVYTEFNKIRVGHIWPVRIGWALWLVATLLVAGDIMRRLLAGRADSPVGRACPECHRRVRRGDAAGRFWNSICHLGAVRPVVAGPSAIVEPRRPSVWTAGRGSGNRGIAPGHGMEPAKLGPLLGISVTFPRKSAVYPRPRGSLLWWRCNGMAGCATGR